MWSVKDMFYGESEPVWILRPDNSKKDDNRNAESKGGERGGENQSRGSAGARGGENPSRGSAGTQSGAQAGARGGENLSRDGGGARGGENTNRSGNTATGGGKKQAEKESEYTNLSSVPYYPYYYQDYATPPARREEPRSGNYYPDYAPSRREESRTGNYYPDYAPARREEPRSGNYYPDYAPPARGGNGMQSRGGNGMESRGGNGMESRGGNGMESRGGNGMESRGGNGMQNRDTRVVLKVPICCGECVESVEAALYSIRGIKSVECNTRSEKVTVVTSAAPENILMACRRAFKKSRFWTDYD